MSQDTQNPSPAPVAAELNEAELDEVSGGQKQSSGSATNLTNSVQTYVNNVVTNAASGFTSSGTPSTTFNFPS
ncbi:MAG TPA: hypothetical protein PKI03_04490 [Pseudomonadota bacterium]|nr:hypothetical protein [Pseudomonadota bacterium]